MSNSFQRNACISGAVLVVSAIAHGVLLWMPLPPSPEPTAAPQSSSEDNTAMTVVSLPEPATAQAPEPEPDPEPAPPSTEPVPIEPELNDPPASPPAPPEIPEPEPPQALDPEPEPEPPVQPEPAPSVNEPPATEGPLMVYGDDFPHPEEAEGGCFGFSACRRVSGAGTYRSVARSLIANLENQGYEVSLRDDLEDTGRNVYELSPPDAGAATQYLMVFSDHDGSAIYVMSDQILTLNELRTMQA